MKKTSIIIIVIVLLGALYFYLSSKPETESSVPQNNNEIINEETPNLETDGQLIEDNMVEISNLEEPVLNENAEYLPEEGVVFCTMDAKECPDGSFVSRVAPDCEFAACPSEIGIYPAEAVPFPEFTPSEEAPVLFIE